MDRQALSPPDVLQSIASYQNILVRVRTVARLVQDRLRHTITEYELTIPQGEDDAPARREDRFQD